MNNNPAAVVLSEKTLLNDSNSNEQETQNLITMLRMFYISLIKARKMNFSMLYWDGQHRNFYFLSVESTKSLLEKYHSSETVSELTTYKQRFKTVKFIAETNGHGDWIKWK